MLKRNKRKVKQSPVEDKQVEVNTTVITTKQKMSMKTNGISGTLKYKYIAIIDVFSLLMIFICLHFHLWNCSLSLLHVLSEFI